MTRRLVPPLTIAPTSVRAAFPDAVPASFARARPDGAGPVRRLGRRD